MTDTTQPTSALLARITAYKGFIVCELLAKESIENEVATSLDRPGNIGQVIMNTHKNLGVSAEAIELLKQVPRGRDSIGDVDWFASKPAGDCFGWLGGPYALKKPADCETARGFSIRSYVAIQNDVPEGAMKIIDDHEAGNA